MSAFIRPATHSIKFARVRNHFLTSKPLLKRVLFYSPSLSLLHVPIVSLKFFLNDMVFNGSVVNKITLIGRIGSDPSTNEVGDRRVTNYTLATSETRPDKEGNITSQ